MSYRKTCEKCGSRYTIPLSSIDKIICDDCKHLSDWKLKPGQVSVLIEGKIGYDIQAEKR